MKGDNHGFTLLEIILALSILAAIGVITINILSNQIAMRQKLGDLNNDQHSLDAALNRVVKDIQGAYISDQKNISSLNILYRPIVPQFYTERNNFVFFTMAYQSILNKSNESNQAFVRYYIQTNQNDSTQKQLVRVVDTDLVNSIMKDDVGLNQILLDDVEKFTVDFWDGSKFRTEWNSQVNDTQNKLPKLVRVHLSCFSSEKLNSIQTNDPTNKKVIYSLDTIVYLTNTQGQAEAVTPTWTEFKWN